MEYGIVKTDEEPVESYLALDRKIANLFHSCAKNTKEYPNDYGEMRRLKIELQNLCGITELEAFNVLIYRNVSDYIGKYNGGEVAEVKRLEDTAGIILGNNGIVENAVISIEN